MHGLTGTLDPAITALPGKFCAAVYGGPDSLALLILAQAAFGARVCALTVDHGLRSESAAEAATVARVCADRGIPHAILRWAGDKPAANLQAAARTARYDLMRDWCAANSVAWLATAHHADDQAETLLMRLARGSGSGGLTGIRARRDLGRGVTLLRPLLGVRRAELAEIVAAAGLTALDDPSNHNPRFDRTQARTLLAATPWLNPVRLAAGAGHLAEAEAALDWTANLSWDSRTEQEGEVLSVDASGLPQELRRRLLGRALATFGHDADGPESVRFMARLDAGGSATLGAILGQGGDRWTFRRAPPPRKHHVR